MAILPNWGQSDPWGKQVESQRAADAQVNQAITGGFDRLTRTFDALAARKKAVQERNQQFRDREYKIISDETAKLYQTHSGNKVTDMQLTQLGDRMKKEYYDAVKNYQNSDKGEEAKKEFMMIKDRAINSASVVSGSLDNLTAQMDVWKNLYKTDSVSDANDPLVREFIEDLNDPETPLDKYTIVPDEETGELRYVDAATGGNEVNFSLNDIAEGKNAFLPIERADMSGIVQGLTKDLASAVKQEKTDWGVVEKTDWSAMENVIDSRIDDLLSEDKQFRAIASEMGYDYQDVEQIRQGQPYTLPSGEVVDDIQDLDGLKAAMRQELKDGIEKYTPHQEKVLLDTRATEVDKFKAEQDEAVAAEAAQVFEQAVAAKDPAAFNNYLGKPAVLNGLKGLVHSVTPKGKDKVTLTIRSGQKGREDRTFDLNNLDDLALFQSTMTGQDYNLIKQANINSLLIQE